MSEYKDNNYEPNFILQSAKPAGNGVKADDAKAVAAEETIAEADAAKECIAKADAAKVAGAKADAVEETAAETSADEEAAAKADVAAFLAEADAEVEGAKKATDAKSAADAAGAKSAADAADTAKNTPAIKDAAPAGGSADKAASDDRMTYMFDQSDVDSIKEQADAEAAKRSAEAASAEAAKSAPAKESPAAEVLRAAAAKADALKAVAAKADPANEPYRRETSAIEDPVYSGTSVAGNGFVMRDAENSASGPADNTDSASNAGATSNTGTAGSADASRRPAGGNTTGNRGFSQSGTYSSTASAGSSNDNSYSRFNGYSGMNAGGYSAGGYASGGYAAGGYAAGGASDNNGRPRFENPSFDPGQTGHYTDPRENFRGAAAAGASASWSNGEVHRSRKQMKDQLNKQKKQKKAPQPVMLTRRSLGLLIAGCLLLSCLFGLGGAALGTTLVKQNQANTAQTTTAAATPSESTATSADYTLENATNSSMTIKEITSAAKNSVVEIRTESVASDSWMQQYVTQGAGSGVIISDDGYIMTNNHVIEGANKITVTTADEKEYQATLIGTDETNDVAVIKIKASGLTPATYGNSDQLEVGDMAVAIGNPLGELGGTVTAGIISATDRELSIDGKTMHLLQTDSSINPGNSGGGLFNGSGQLIGLVVAKSSGSDVEGLGFAIPINTAADVAKQLIDKGYVSGQPSTGMTYQEGTTSSGNGSDPFSSFDSFFGSGSSASGVFIYSVNGENAKKAGFQSGDQVYMVDDKEITSFDELSSVITSHKVGDKVTFTIIRNGEKKKIKLELEEKTNAQQNNGQNQNGQNGQTAPGQNDQGQAAPDQNAPNQTVPGEDGQNNIYDGGQSWQDFFNSFF